MARHSLLSCCLFLVLACGAAAGEAPEKAKAEHPADAAAARLWAVTEVVLDNHVEAPARQQMLLAASRSLLQAAGATPPQGFGRRVSGLVTREQFAEFLKETWPKDAKPTADELRAAALAGMIQSIPGDVRLVTAEELKARDERRRVAEQIQGNRYVGLGVQVRFDEKEKLVQLVTPIRGGPAHKGKMRPGDYFIAVDGKSMEGLSLRKVVEILRGELGSEVTVTVRQPGSGEKRDVKLTRSVVPFENVQGFRRGKETTWEYRIDPEGAVAYAAIRSFSSGTLHELRQLERRLRERKAKALVLDLRFASGGAVQHTALVADGLLDGGVVLKTRDARGQVRERKADRECLFRDMPLAVLVTDQGSWEMAWLAAALQDNGRAVVVGKPLHLKPYIRGLVNLADGAGALVLPVAARERGKAPSPPPGANVVPPNMVRPDHTVPLSEERKIAISAWLSYKNYTELPAGVRDEPPEDPQLAKAVEVLRAALKKKAAPD